jgi:hypothetical protein
MDPSAKRVFLFFVWNPNPLNFSLRLFLCFFLSHDQITREMVTSGLLTKELCVLIKMCWDRDPAVR